MLSALVRRPPVVRTSPTCPRCSARWPDDGRAESKIAGASDRTLGLIDNFMVRSFWWLIKLPIVLPWKLLKRVLGGTKRASIAVLIFVIVLTSGAGLGGVLLSLIAALAVVFAVTLGQRVVLGQLTAGRNACHLGVLVATSRQSFSSTFADKKAVIDTALTLFKIQAVILALGWFGNLLTTIGLRGPGSWPSSLANFAIWPLPLIIFVIFVIVSARQVRAIHDEVLEAHGPGSRSLPASSAAPWPDHRPGSRPGVRDGSSVDDRSRSGWLRLR